MIARQFEKVSQYAWQAAEDAELLWLLPLLTMFAPGDRPEMTSDQQPEEASESVASDASVRYSQRTRMKIAGCEERRRQRFSNGRSSLWSL